MSGSIACTVFQCFNVVSYVRSSNLPKNLRSYYVRRYGAEDSSNTLLHHAYFLLESVADSQSNPS